MLKAVVLDLDDTLCPTEAVAFEVENEILAKMGRPPMSRDIHISTWGMHVREGIALRSPGIDLDEFDALYVSTLDAYVRSGKLNAIPAENFVVLDQLCQDGKLVMIVSARSYEEMYHLLEPNHELASRIHKFYYRDTMQFHKPDPRAFNELLFDHALYPSEVVYVGDSVGDAVAAKGAGLHFIASLESRLRTKDEFAHQHVDAFIDDFSQLLAAVSKLDTARPSVTGVVK